MLFWLRVEWVESLETREKINQHWSQVAKTSNPSRTRWWESPAIKQHINRLVCGEPISGFGQGLTRKAMSYGKSYNLGVSVGSGTGSKEMNLIQQGLVKNFILFELSDERIKQGKLLAEKLGLSKNVVFVQEDYLKAKLPENVDFVHWNNALHHMFDVYESVKWSYDILEYGGMFYMDDYVGPSRFQYSDEVLALLTRIRSLLPKRYLSNPRDSSKLLSSKIVRCDPEKLIAIDPSEAVEPDKILETVKHYFPSVKITQTGGYVYLACLGDIIHNIDEENETDKAILDLLMLVDELMVNVPKLGGYMQQLLR